MTRALPLDRILHRRLATQHLTSAPLPKATDVVRQLLAVQSQDAPLAAWSLGMRTRTESYAAVLAEQVTGTFVRTHVLRPTWHHVAAEDLRWLQALTGPKVESGGAARLRGLGLDEAARERAIAALRDLLAGRNALTRRQIQAEFTTRGLPSSGEQMAHQLMVAEVRAVICSGPPAGTEHTYVLVDEAIAPTPDDDLPRRDRPEAIRRLARRFVTGHGPADERDLLRWAAIPLGESRRAFDELVEAGSLERITVAAGDSPVTLFADPAAPPRAARAHTAYLLPTFDEVTLTFARTRFPTAATTIDRSRAFAEAGGGVALVDGLDVGVWKRTVRAGALTVTLRPERALTAHEHAALTAATERLAAFLDVEGRLVVRSAA